MRTFLGVHNEGVGGPFVSVEWEIMGRSWEITGDRARWHAEVGPVVLKTQNLDIECGWRSEDIITSIGSQTGPTCLIWAQSYSWNVT